MAQSKERCAESRKRQGRGIHPNKLHRRGVGIIMLSKMRKTEASKATTVVWQFEAMVEQGATRVLLRANTLC